MDIENNPNHFAPIKRQYTRPNVPENLFSTPNLMEKRKVEPATHTAKIIAFDQLLYNIPKGNTVKPDWLIFAKENNKVKMGFNKVGKRYYPHGENNFYFIPSDLFEINEVIPQLPTLPFYFTNLSGKVCKMVKMVGQQCHFDVCGEVSGGINTVNDATTKLHDGRWKIVDKPKIKKSKVKKAMVELEEIIRGFDNSLSSYMRDDRDCGPHPCGSLRSALVDLVKKHTKV